VRSRCPGSEPPEKKVARGRGKGAVTAEDLDADMDAYHAAAAKDKTDAAPAAAPEATEAPSSAKEADATAAD